MNKKFGVWAIVALVVAVIFLFFFGQPTDNEPEGDALLGPCVNDLDQNMDAPGTNDCDGKSIVMVSL